MTKVFENCARPFDPYVECYDKDRDLYNYYGFTNISPFLYTWSGLLQIVLSAVASKMISGEWLYDGHGIYKCEGGITVKGLGSIVLLRDRLYHDYDHSPKAKAKKDIKRVQELVTKVILSWNPMKPVDSMLAAAGEYAGINFEEVKSELEKCEGFGPFSGDSLSSLFDHNPFAKFPEDRDYLRYCHTQISGKTEEQVNEIFRIEDLSEHLLEELNKAVDKYKQYGRFLCASPKTFENGNVCFWLNDGNYFGWHTEDEINALIAWIESNQLVPSKKEQVFQIEKT